MAADSIDLACISRFWSFIWEAKPCTCGHVSGCQPTCGRAASSGRDGSQHSTDEVQNVQPRVKTWRGSVLFGDPGQASLQLQRWLERGQNPSLEKERCCRDSCPSRRNFTQNQLQIGYRSVALLEFYKTQSVFSGVDGGRQTMRTERRKKKPIRPNLRWHYKQLA